MHGRAWVINLGGVTFFSKNDHNSKNRNRKNLKICFFLFSQFWIFHVNLTTFEIKIQKVVKSTWKIWNRLNRKKNQISDFSDFYFSSYAEKQCGRQFWNAVEREPVETRALNPTASKASYKPKQRSYRKTWGGYFLEGSIPRPQFSMYILSSHTLL